MSVASPPTLAALQARHGPRYRWWVLLTVMIGTMASIMASTIINVALPDLSRHFVLGQDRAQWLSSGFMAAMTVSMLTTPWLLERHGYRRLYAGAVALLMAGGIAGGLAQTFGWVLAMRVVEGLAAGVLQPIPAIIVLHAFDRGEQGKAMGVFGFGVVLAPAVGPSIGGVLVEAFGWRSIFFVVVPFCLVALALARRYLPHSAPGGAAVRERSSRLDVVGLALLTVAVLAGLNGLAELQGRTTGIGAGLLVLTALAAAAFVVRQRRIAEPLMEPRLFAYRVFAMGSCVSFIYGAALFGSTYLVPVFMLLGLAMAPSRAGAVLLPAGIVLALVIPVAGRLADRIDPARLVAFGLLLLAASFGVMVSVGLDTALAMIMLWTVIGRVGLGCILPALSLGAMRGLPAELISRGSSAINFLRQLGGAVGISGAGIVLEWRLRVHDDLPLRAFHETFAVLGLITAVAIVAAWQMHAGPPPAGPAP